MPNSMKLYGKLPRVTLCKNAKIQRSQLINNNNNKMTDFLFCFKNISATTWTIYRWALCPSCLSVHWYFSFNNLRITYVSFFIFSAQPQIPMQPHPAPIVTSENAMVTHLAIEVPGQGQSATSPVDVEDVALQQIQEDIGNCFGLLFKLEFKPH